MYQKNLHKMKHSTFDISQFKSYSFDINMTQNDALHFVFLH